MALIDIKKNEFNIVIELRYATENNITGKKIFIENKCLLIKEAADKITFSFKNCKYFSL